MPGAAQSELQGPVSTGWQFQVDLEGLSPNQKFQMQVLEDAMGLCRERLSLSTDQERPVSAAQQQHISGGREAEYQSQSRQQGPSCPSEGCPEGQKENSEAARKHPRPAPFAPSLVGEMSRAFSEAHLLLS